MGMDIRLPIGLLFSAIGLLLTGFGAFSNREIYRASLGINVNVLWGLVLLVFGIVMLAYGRRAGAINEARSRTDELAKSAKRGDA
jgi:hypothetical protein